MKSAMKCLLQFINVFVGAFHRCEAARVFAREGFSACPKERDEKVLSNKRAEGDRATAHNFRQEFGWPRNFGQTLLP